MGQSASQAAAFYRDVAKNRKLWTCQDEGGVPAPMKTDGRRAMPFWSSRSRVEKIIKNTPAYAVFEPLELSWESFLTEWVPDLKDDNLLVGVNWSGKNVVGYDLEPDDVIANTTYYIEKGTT